MKQIERKKLRNKGNKGYKKEEGRKKERKKKQGTKERKWRVRN
jgi:hypothetical protein